MVLERSLRQALTYFHLHHSVRWVLPPAGQSVIVTRLLLLHLHKRRELVTFRFVI
jgi:hypothetical protein